MKVTKILHILPVLLIICCVDCKHTHHSVFSEKGRQSDVSAHKRVIDPLSVIGLAVSIGSTIQGGICTFTDVCSEDLGARIDGLEMKLDAMQKDIDGIKVDVKKTLLNTQVKWYLDQITFINNERKLVLRSIKEADDSQSAKDRKVRFCAQTLGAEGQDNTVNKALMFIAKLVTENNIVETFSGTVGSANGYKRTWQFIKELFTLQEHGYASMILALGIRYDKDTTSYKTEMAIICNQWSKARSEEFNKLCGALQKNPVYQNRRKLQMDFLFNMAHTWRWNSNDWKSYLPALPVLLDKKDCSQFKHASGLHYAAGHLFVAQRGNKNILIVHPSSLAILNTVRLGGQECGGSCHPVDVSVNVEKKVLAVAAKSTSSGEGTSYVLFYKINGDFNSPRDISYQYYHTLTLPTDAQNDVRSLAFCGDRFGYADHSQGAMFHWKTKEVSSNLQLDLTTQKNWYMYYYEQKTKISTINYMECSNSRDSWVLEKTEDENPSYGNKDGVGSVAVSNLMDTTYDIVESLSNKVAFKDMMSDGKYKADWHLPRMEKLAGVAMDSEQNLFFGTNQIYRNCINGIYKRMNDGKLHVIREWQRDKLDSKWDVKYPMRVGDMAADDKGYLYVLQKDGDKDQCLYKYDHEKNIEDIKLDGLEEETE